MAQVRTQPSPHPTLAVSPDALAAFCRRHHIRRLAFFGSVLRDDFGPQSDVDVLVEYDPGHEPGLRSFAIQEELGRLLGHEVDLLAFRSVAKRVRDRVLAEAQVQYDRDRGGVLAILRDDGVERRRPTVDERDQVRLGHMLDAAREALEIGREGDRERFETDRISRRAIERLVQIVGEAARRIAPETQAAHPNIPWANITGMRNVLVHDYDDLNQDTVWDTVIDHLPVLVTQLERIVTPAPPS